MLFSLIKVTADFDNVIYVLSFDPEIVATALGKTYSESGERFLEKIIQVPLHLPKARKADIFNEVLYPGVTSILESHKFAVTDEELNTVSDSIRQGLETKLSTPRLVKRFLNTLSIALPLLRNESYVHDVIMVEGLRICYPDTYEYVFSNRNLFITQNKSENFKSDEKEKQERQTVDDYLKEKEDALGNLLSSIFPRLHENNLYQISNVDLADKQRVGSPEYFDRYFTYSIPKSGISDTLFSEFLSSLESKDLEESIEEGKELIRSSSEDKFLRKLEYKIESSEDIPIELAHVLVILGQNFSKNLNLLNLNTSLKRVANLIIELIKRVPEQETLNFTKELLRESTSIILTAEIALSLHNSVNKKPLFFEDDQQELEEYVANLIKRDAEENGPFYLRESIKMKSPLLFNLWTYSPQEGEVEDFIVKSFNDKSTNVFEFLKAFTPLRGVDEDEKFHFGLFEADQYTKVKRLVSPKIIYDILKKDYESVMNDSGGMDDLFFDGEIEDALAKSFAHYFKKDEDFKESEKEDSNID